MQAEISHFVLIAAALCAVFLSLPTLLGSKSRAPLFVHLWKPALGITFAGLSFALIMLIWAFLTNDFSIAYVANNSNTKLDPVYKISAVWGSHEGSMLLWVWTITVWASLFAVFSRDDELFKSRVLGVLLGVTGLICLFLIFTSNPFERLLPLVPPEGKDLNPILQDIGMILHPPMLFLGYAGTALCFAFGLGALMEGKVRPESLRGLTTISVIAWLFLTAGNVLGSWWAYNELGWGGWWFWDPVENSSFVPWLLMTAQLHALVLLRFRAHLTKTVLFFCIVSFALCLLGTFIVRSGVIQSVHAFASDPNRGAFLLVISLLMVVPALFLFMIRAPKFESAKQISGIEDISLVLAVLLLAVTAVCVLFGTLYPLVHEALGKGSLSVGAPYFNSIFAPMAILAALMIGAVQLKKSPMWTWGATFILSAIAALYCGFFTEVKSSVYTTAGVFSALWIICSFMASLRSKKHKNFFALVAHLGIAVSIIGVIGDTQYSQEAVVRMGPGQGRPLGDVIFVYEETRKVDTNALFADEGKVLVLNKNEDVIDELHPQRQTYKSNGMEMTAAGISHGFFRDFYVSMGNRLSSDEFLVRLSIRPLVSWIWIGGLIMLLSAVFSSAWRRKEWSQS